MLYTWNSYTIVCQLHFKNAMSVALVGVADWALACEPKGHRFDSQSGHKPGLQARSLVKRHMRGNHTLLFLSLSFSLPSPLSKNKYITSLKKRMSLNDSSITIDWNFTCKSICSKHIGCWLLLKANSISIWMLLICKSTTAQQKGRARKWDFKP